MKIKDFITQWVTTAITDPTIIVPTGTVTIQDFKIITDGSSMTKLKCYSWSCTPHWLYFKDVPVCCKTNNIFIIKEEYIKQLQEIFENLDLFACVATDNISEYERVIPQLLKMFINCAFSGNLIDEDIFKFMKSFNVKFEDKYLNYCKNSSIDKFIEITKKHYKRAQCNKEIEKTFDGLWYKFNNNLSGVTVDAHTIMSAF